MKKNTTIMDYIFLGIFGLGAMSVFAVELIFPNQQPNPRETVLYNALELGLSLGFGWILQRIDSRKQFRENLKQFALSAYRRISDIEKSVNRIRNAIDQMRLSYPQGKVHELDILRMVAEEMDNTVNSSIADWADIIGEEISKKERIEELQKERHRILETQQKTSTDNTKTDQRLEELRSEIDNLRSNLPYLLRSDVQDYQTSLDSYPREGRLSDTVIEHYYSEAKSHSCITIRVRPLIDITVKENLDKVIHGRPYSIKLEQNMFTLHAGLANKDGDIFGEIINPFTTIYSNDFVVSLITLIGAVTKITGSLSITPDLATNFVLGSAELVNIPPTSEGELLLKIPVSELDFAYG